MVNNNIQSVKLAGKGGKKYNNICLNLTGNGAFSLFRMSVRKLRFDMGKFWESKGEEAMTSVVCGVRVFMFEI